MTTLTACSADSAHAPLAGQLQHSYLLQRGGLIEGRRGSSAADASLPVTDPATGQRLPTPAANSVGDARAAARAATPAQAGWAALPARERAALLMAWHAQIIAHADDLALLMTREQGKPLAEARGEVMFGASFVAWYAEEAKRVHGEVLQTYSADRRVLTL